MAIDALYRNRRALWGEMNCNQYTTRKRGIFASRLSRVRANGTYQDHRPVPPDRAQPSRVSLAIMTASTYVVKGFHHTL